MSNIETNNNILKECITKLLALNAGVQIEIDSSLYIRKHSESEFIVGGVEEKNPYQVKEWKEKLPDLKRALDYLVTYRNQYKIGSDF